MPALPHPLRLPRYRPAGVRRVPPPLAPGARAVVPALRPARARVRALPDLRRLAAGSADGPLGGVARRGRPVVPLLVRVRETATQTALTPAERLANVAEAFAVRAAGAGGRRRAGAAPEGPAPRLPAAALVRPLILVDDVFTTGATLAAAAGALERAGARTVLAVTFGRAAIPDFS